MQDVTRWHVVFPGSSTVRFAHTVVAAMGLALLLALWFFGVARAEIVHEIQPGENLSQVARQYNVDPRELAAYNQILDFNHIVIGQKLRIPDSGAESGAESGANSVAEPSRPELTVDDEVSVPDLPGSEGYHVVRQGESLGGIARLYGMSLDELLQLNSFTDANHVLIGQMLRLSARVEATVPLGQKAPAPADTIYVVQEEDTLASIAEAHNTSVEQIMSANGLPNAGFVYVGQPLRIQMPAAADEAFGVAAAPADGERWILIDLGDQTLTAYQGDVILLHTYVSTGKASTPTQPGTFAVYHKYDSQHMFGEGYDLPGVPWVMYYDGAFAIHGAYWHANFGVPTSHGCTNMRIDEAKALYDWAPMGTRVEVQY
jgi:lipoprotein-anchoring transpeptidase ErfK/SrfK